MTSIHILQNESATGSICQCWLWRIKEASIVVFWTIWESIIKKEKNDCNARKCQELLRVFGKFFERTVICGKSDHYAKDCLRGAHQSRRSNGPSNSKSINQRGSVTSLQKPRTRAWRLTLTSRARYWWTARRAELDNVNLTLWSEMMHRSMSFTIYWCLKGIKMFHKLQRS